jgi:transforming growth factor-beta-induced protein
MHRFTRIALCATAAAGIGFGILSPLAQKRAVAEDATMMEKKDIIDTAVGPGMQEVTTVVTAIKAADLVDTLKGKGPFTVFAPTNAAFAKLPAGTLDDLLKPENKDKLKDLLLYHVHAGDAIMAKDVKTMKLTTAEGKDLDVKVDNGTVWINNAKVIKTDVVCSNGVIHWIDTVVMPPKM